MKKIRFLAVGAVVALVLSGCGDDRAVNNASGQDEIQNEVQNETSNEASVESKSIHESEVQNETSDEASVETKSIHEFHVEKDVLLIYEYDDYGELSCVHLNDNPETSGFLVSGTEYGEDGYLTSIKVRWEGRRMNPAPWKTDYIDDVVEDAMIAEYNEDGQITYLRYRSPFDLTSEGEEKVSTYKVTYNADNGHITVISGYEEVEEKYGDKGKIVEEYDSDLNLVFEYWDMWDVIHMSGYVRHYTEYEYDENGNVTKNQYQETFDAQGNKLE